MTPNASRTQSELIDTVDRTAALVMQHQHLLVAIVAKMPNARDVIAEYEAISAASIKGLKAQLPHADFGVQDRTRAFLLDSLRDQLGDHDVGTP